MNGIDAANRAGIRLHRDRGIIILYGPGRDPFGMNSSCDRGFDVVDIHTGEVISQHTSDPTNRGDVIQLSQHDIRFWEDAEAVARFTNERNEPTHCVFTYTIPVDRGTHVSPRYGIIIAPKVGDPVSMTFNGDYYPEGIIKKISDTGRVIKTSTNKQFYRRTPTSPLWLQGGTWALISGHHQRLNPHV